MAGNIREKQKKVREQGFRAAKSDKLYPRELQNAEQWEDARIGTYGAKNITRQQQNFSRDHMIGYGQAIANRAKQKKTSNKEISTRRQYEEAFSKRKKNK